VSVLDDFMARKHAQNVLGLDIVGTIGVLLDAKDKDYVKEVKPILDQLIKHNMYVDEKLYWGALTLAKEN